MTEHPLCLIASFLSANALHVSSNAICRLASSHSLQNLMPGYRCHGYRCHGRHDAIGQLYSLKGEVCAQRQADTAGARAARWLWLQLSR